MRFSWCPHARHRRGGTRVVPVRIPPVDHKAAQHHNPRDAPHHRPGAGGDVEGVDDRPDEGVQRAGGVERQPSARADGGCDVYFVNAASHHPNAPVGPHV